MEQLICTDTAGSGSMLASRAFMAKLVDKDQRDLLVARVTRWGRTTCSNTSGAELLYAGRAAGSFWTEQGGGANYLCLPEQPENSTYTAGSQGGRAYLYGAEYQTGGGVDNGPFQSVYQHNVPCAVCYAPTREAVVMIPAQLTCPSSWTREYYGYLMANRNT